MVRRFQGDPGGVNAVLASLTGVWISHIHADHHLGLLRVLAERRALVRLGWCYKVQHVNV